MKPFLFFVLAMVMACPSTSIAGLLRTEWFPYKGHEDAIAGPSSREDANIFAASVGGYLAAINDEPENTWLTNLVVSFPDRSSVSFPANHGMS